MGFSCITFINNALYINGPHVMPCHSVHSPTKIQSLGHPSMPREALLHPELSALGDRVGHAKAGASVILSPFLPIFSRSADFSEWPSHSHNMLAHAV